MKSPNPGEMRRYFFGSFDDDHAATEAARECRDRGLDLVDVYGPRPIHGIEDAMGLRRSRLTWACFLFGVFGLSVALYFQYWSSETSWALNVGASPSIRCRPSSRWPSSSPSCSRDWAPSRPFSSAPGSSPANSRPSPILA